MNSTVSLVRIRRMDRVNDADVKKMCRVRRVFEILLDKSICRWCGQGGRLVKKTNGSVVEGMGRRIIQQKRWTVAVIGLSNVEGISVRIPGEHFFMCSVCENGSENEGIHLTRQINLVCSE